MNYVSLLNKQYTLVIDPMISKDFKIVPDSDVDATDDPAVARDYLDRILAGGEQVFSYEETAALSFDMEECIEQLRASLAPLRLLESIGIPNKVTAEETVGRIEIYQALMDQILVAWMVALDPDDFETFVTEMEDSYVSPGDEEYDTWRVVLASVEAKREEASLA